jgi:hypothetical protein
MPDKRGSESLIRAVPVTLANFRRLQVWP